MCKFIWHNVPRNCLHFVKWIYIFSFLSRISLPFPFSIDDFFFLLFSFVYIQVEIRGETFFAIRKAWDTVMVNGENLFYILKFLYDFLTLSHWICFFSCCLLFSFRAQTEEYEHNSLHNHSQMLHIKIASSQANAKNALDI